MKPFAAGLMLLLVSPFGALTQEPPRAPGNAGAPPAVPTFSTRDLGSLGQPYGGWSYPVGIDAYGLVAGNSQERSGQQRAFVWTASGGMLGLGDLGGNYSAAMAVNNGRVVGSSNTRYYESHAFLWSAATGMIDLGHLGGRYSYAQFVNAAGQVLGASYTRFGRYHPFLWSPATGMVDLAGLNNSLDAWPTALSPAGNVVGYINTFSGQRAFFWSAASGIVQLPDLGGSYMTAVAVNDSGQVVGYGYTSTNEIHGFFWSAESGLVDLTGPNEPFSMAAGLNASGQVVGARVVSGQRSAFSWNLATGMQPLAILGAGYSDATAINDSGQIIGTAYSSSNQVHAVIWNADGSITDMGDLGGGYSVARLLSASGKVVGWSYSASGELHDFFWSPSEGLVDLGTNTGYSQGLNDAGQVIGWSYNTSGAQRGWFWSSTTGRMDLNTLYRYSFSTAVAMNASGQVIGDAVTASEEQHAFFWSAEGGMVDLGTLGGRYSHPKALNASGQVIGYSYSLNGQQHGFFWSLDRGMIDLSLNQNFSSAEAINANGQVAVSAVSESGYQHAYLWSVENGMQDLGDLGGGWAYAKALNDAGQVTGQASMPGNYESHAFLWSPETGMVDLGSLGGRFSWPEALNASGQVTGVTYNEFNQQRAFFWSAGTGMVDLGDLGGGFSAPIAINDAGQVTGYSRTLAGETHAFLWTPGGSMVDLGTSGGPQSFAKAINNAGQVLGSSLTSSYNSHGFLWAAGLLDMGDLGGYFSEPASFNSSGEAVGVSNTASWGQHAFFWAPSATMLDLGTLGGTYSYAVAINDDRQIAGQALTPVGDSHAVVWKINGIPPVAVIAAPLTVDSTEANGAPVTLDGSQSSNPSGLPLSYAWYLFSPFRGTTIIGTTAILTSHLPLGANVVTLVVTDSAGFTSTQTFTVTVTDTTPPVMTDVPASMTVEQTSTFGAAVTFPLPKATDISDAAPVVTSDAPVIFPPGTTIVTFTATDASGNQSTATMTVTVRDSTPPSFSATPVPAAALFAVSADQLTSDYVSRIHRFQVNGGGGAVLDRSFTDPSLATPYAATWGPTGDLFVSNIAGSVTRFANPLTDPQAVGTITQNFGQVFGAVFRNGELLVADPVYQQVLRFGFDPAGNPTLNGTIPISPGYGMRSMIVTPWGELLISCYSPNIILRYLIDDSGIGHANGVIQDGIQGEPHGMAFSSSGELFVAGAWSNVIMRYTFNGQHDAIFNGTISVPGYDMVIGIAVSPWGELFAASRGLVAPGGKAIISRWRFDAAGQAVPNGAFACPGGVHELTFGPVQSTQPVPAPVVLDSLGAPSVPYVLPLPTAFDIADSFPVVTSDAPTEFPIGTTTVTFTARDAVGNTANATTTVTVKGKLKPAVSWSNPADIVYGTALSATQLNATASVPGTFTYSPPSGTVLPGGDAQALQVLFTPADAALYDLASASVAINVKKAPQTITFPAIAAHIYTDPPFAPGATASSGLTVTYSIASGPAVIENDKVRITGVGSVTVTANQAGNGNFLPAAPVSRTFAVSKAPQTITFVDPPDQIYGVGGPIELSATSTSGLPVTLSLISGPATLSGNIVTVTGVGTVKITASQAGNANFLAAASVSQTFTISKAAQTISFDPIPNKLFGVAPFTVTATASSGLPVSFAVSSGPATISGNVVTVTGTGTVKIKATQEGDSNYKAATAVTQQFDVTANQTITFAAISNKVYPTAPFALTATASSGLPVTFTVASGPATLSGNILTITGTGTVSVTASQSGGGTYTPAVPVTQTFKVR